jgi:hypothetical protein
MGDKKRQTNDDQLSCPGDITSEIDVIKFLDWFSVRRAHVSEGVTSMPFPFPQTRDSHFLLFLFSAF